MAHSGISSKFFATGNERVYLNGTENNSKFSHSKECFISASKSKIDICNSSFVTVTTTDSTLGFTNGTNVDINGVSNVIGGDHFNEFLLDGSHNVLCFQNMENMLWSGSNGKCQLIENANLSVCGMDNEIVGKSNCNLTVCGNGNMIVANETENFQLRGHLNEVMADGSKNVSIYGHANRVSVSDISIRHSLRLIKATPGEIPENQIDICGIPTDSSIYADILCPPTIDRYEFSMKTCANFKSPNCVSDTLWQDKNLNSTDNNSCTVMPQVQIHYLDQAYINRNSYNLGIFHILVEGLADFHDLHLPIKVKVMANELDKGSYNYQLTPCGKILTLSGSKNGTQQTLKLTGNRIIDDLGNSFSIYIESIIEEDFVGNDDEYSAEMEGE